MNKVHIKTNDMVMVISGKSKGLKGKVLEVSPSEGKVIVEGVQIVTKHLKPRKAGDPGGLVKAESALYACKVGIYCSSCRGPRRIKNKILADGSKIRVCAKCGESFE